MFERCDWKLRPRFEIRRERAVARTVAGVDRRTFLRCNGRRVVDDGRLETALLEPRLQHRIALHRRAVVARVPRRTGSVDFFRKPRYHGRGIAAAHAERATALAQVRIERADRLAKKSGPARRAL